MLPGWKSTWRRPASCSLAVMTPRALASFWRIARPLGSGQLGELLLDELVERDRLADLRRDEVVLEEELPLPLLAQRDRRDRGDADRGQFLGPFPLVASLAAAEPLAEHRPPVGDEVVLDVDGALGEVDAVDDAMRPGFDRRQPPLLAPLVEPEAAGPEQDVAPGGPRAPTSRSRRTGTIPTPAA